MRIVTTIYEKKEDGNTICRRGLVELADFLLDEVIVDGCRYGVGMLANNDNRRKTKAIIFREDSVHVRTIRFGVPSGLRNVAEMGGVDRFNEMVAMSGYMEIEYPESGDADFRIVELDQYRMKPIEEVIRDVFNVGSVE